MVILKADACNARRIFELSRSTGRPAVFPTDTIYGIGAPLSSVAANELIYKIKQRPADKPFPILAGSLEQARQYADFSKLTDEALKLIERTWSERVTFIFNTKSGINPIYSKNSTIAIRIPACDWLRAALLGLGEPVTATSVNKNNQPALNSFTDIARCFGNEVSLILNGKPATGASSDIYDVTSDIITRIR